MKDKIKTADEAIALIRDGDAVSCSGFVGTGTPEELIAALERRFFTTDGPRDLTLVFAAAPGDGKERGLNRLAHEGLVQACDRRPLVARAEAREAGDGQSDRGVQPAAGLDLAALPRHRRRIGRALLTKVGLRTFVDPRQDGGKIKRAQPKTSCT